MTVVIAANPNYIQKMPKFQNSFSIFFIISICLCLFVCDSYALCCRRYSPMAVVQRGDARAIANMRSLSISTTSVCGDGIVHEGSYCATGSCNWFGCDCAGHCFGDWDSDYH